MHNLNYLFKESNVSLSSYISHSFLRTKAFPHFADNHGQQSTHHQSKNSRSQSQLNGDQNVSFVQINDKK